MKTCPLVSVIIPTYNRADIVRTAIESVLAQTYPNIELIVVDDGSTDHTQACLSAYGERIVVLTQDNAGPSVARNRGIEAARGEIVAFLDSDDYWLPAKLARQVEALEKAGPSAPCCLCNCTNAYSDGTKTSTFQMADIVPTCSTGLWLNPVEVLSNRFVIFNQAVAIRRDVLKRIGSFDEKLPMFCEDYELALRLSLEGPWVIIRDELVVHHDATPDSLGQRALREEIRLWEDRVYMRERIATLVENDTHHARFRRLAQKELRRVRRELWAVRLTRQSFSGAVALGRSVRFIERIGQALFRRSPFYPTLEVRQLA